MIIDIIVLAVLILVSIIFYKGNAASLLGWISTKPKYEREQTDTVKLSTFIGKLLFVVCGCVVLLIVGEWTDLFYITTAGLVLLVGVAIFGFIYTHTGNRFKK